MLTEHLKEVILLPADKVSHLDIVNFRRNGYDTMIDSKNNI